MILWIALAASIIPTCILLFWFYKSDRFPEPWKVVRKTFLLGVAVCVPVLIVDAVLKHWQPPQTAPYPYAFYEAFMIASIPEEFFKYLVLLLYSIKHQEFNEPFDGIVYGVTASLGFATLENVLYVSTGGISVALLRAFTAVPGHALTGAVMGFFLGMTLRSPKQKPLWYILALLIPIILHGLYDLPLMIISALHRLKAPGPSGWMLLTFVLVIILEWKLALRYKRFLQNEQVEKI